MNHGIFGGLNFKGIHFPYLRHSRMHATDRLAILPNQSKRRLPNHCSESYLLVQFSLGALLYRSENVHPDFIQAGVLNRNMPSESQRHLARQPLLTAGSGPVIQGNKIAISEGDIRNDL